MPAIRTLILTYFYLRVWFNLVTVKFYKIVNIWIEQNYQHCNGKFFKKKLEGKVKHGYIVGVKIYLPY
jgi:hypothetical protein